MHSARILIYDAVSQTALTYSHHQGHHLARWSVAAEPQQLAEYVLKGWTLPALLQWVPREQAIAIVRCHPGQPLPGQPLPGQSLPDQFLNAILELRRSDFSQLRQITLPAVSKAPTGLAITPDQNYALVSESTHRLHLVDLQLGTVQTLNLASSVRLNDLLLDPQMQFFLNPPIAPDRAWELHRIDHLTQGQFTYLGQFSLGQVDQDQHDPSDRIRFSPDANAFVHTGCHDGRLFVTYRTLQRSHLSLQPTAPSPQILPRDQQLDSLEPPIAAMLWAVQMPIPPHEAETTQSWCSDIAFLDAHRLILSIGPTLALLDAATGAVKAEYKLDAMVTAIAVDAMNHRVIAATCNGMVVVPIKAFHLNISELRSLTPSHPPRPQSPPSDLGNLPPMSPQAKLFVSLVTFVGLGGLGIMLWPWFIFLFYLVWSPTIINKSYPIERYQLHEKVYDVGFLNHEYERVYTVQDGWWLTEIGRFTNEEHPQQVEHPVAPKLVGDWLVVFSGSHLFLWQSGRPPIAFDPHRAVGWYEYANQPAVQINEHYDYHATDFLIQGDRWIFEYRCSHLSCQGGGKSTPAKILFFSDDRGTTFHLLKNSTS